MTSSSDVAPSSSFDEAVHTVRDRLREHHATYLDALRSSVLAPLRTALDDRIEAHEEACTSLEALQSPTRQELWATVRAYRQDTMETVWRPLRATLETLDLGRCLVNQRASLLEACSKVPTEIPQEVTQPPMDSRPELPPLDDWIRRTETTIRRGWQLVREQLGAHSRDPRPVPLAKIVSDHVERTLPDPQVVALDRAEQRIVKWVARLERDASAWTHRLLDIERILDRPDFHGQSEDFALPPPTADPTSGVMDPDVDALHAEVTDRVDVLHDTLHAGRTLDLENTNRELEEAREMVLAEIRSSADRTHSIRALVDWFRSSTNRNLGSSPRLPDWSSWFDEVTQRLTYLDVLATLRDRLSARQDALVTDLVEAGLRPARTATQATVDRLCTLREEIDQLLSGPDENLTSAFSSTVNTATDLLEDTLLAPLGEFTPRRATDAVVASHREAVTTLLDDQPDGFVVHPLVEADTDRVDPEEPFALPWRTECEDIFDEVLFDAWRASPTPAVRTAETVSERATEVRAVVEFHLGAALQEVKDHQAGVEPDTDEAGFLDNARELAREGLRRALDLLAADDDAFAEAAGEVSHSTWRATTEAWTDLHDRIRAAGASRVHLLRLRGELVRGVHWLATETQRQIRGTSTQLRRTLHRIHREAQRLAHLGHAAVGAPPADEAALRETVDTLSTVDAVLADLPLVYRRLFSFRPVHNQDLLVGRGADRAAIDRHVERWREGLTSALVLTGPAGSGRTSLLNVLRQSTFQSAERHSLDLSARITSETEFARRVVQALNLSLDPDSDLTLDAVADHVREEPIPDRLRVCFVEGLEHVFHRCVGGTRLGARVLEFLSETDARVFWITTMTDACWQWVEAGEPAAARLMTRHALEPLQRAELEELIMTRHRRSGLPLQFDLPDESTHPILARRARAIDDEERRQALLQSEFFDHLYEVCGQNVMLALFYWFRSVSLDADDTTLWVRPLEPVSFDILDTLPLPYAFALKALLEHGTLTVDELATILGVSPPTSRSLLETLGNALVIAPADRVEGPGVFQFSSIDRETRYRIRPLLVHPVTRSLRSRNVVH